MAKEKPVIQCRYKCGTLLQNFDEAENKYLEYQTEILHTPERCQSIKARAKGGSSSGFENPIQKAVEQPRPQPMQAEQTKLTQTKEEMIAEAQRIRKEENDNLIEAIKTLTLEIGRLANAIELRNESLP